MGDRKHVLLAAPYSAKKLAKWIKECGYVYTQPKLNGERIWWDGTYMFTSEGNYCESLPHILEQLHDNWSGIPVDGEAYIHGWSRQKIHSVVSRTVNLHPQYREMKFHLFDLAAGEFNQGTRFDAIGRNKYRFDHTPDIRLLPTALARSHDDLYQYTINLVHQGYEGSIVRHPTGIYMALSRRWMMKWKPGGRDRYKLIEMLEGRGKYAGTLGALIVEGSSGETFNVGSFAIPDEERVALWACKEEYEGRVHVMIRYTELTDKGVPPSGVFEMVVE